MGVQVKLAVVRHRASCLSLVVAALLLLGGCASHPLPESRDMTTPVSSSATAAELWRVFERYEGAPYRYGGTSASGFDCSGFIIAAYREGLNQSLPRTTGQMLAAGRMVGRNRLAAGDLVFFEIDGKVQHAGIYMGDNRFIHSSTSVGVTESSLTGYYWRDRFIEARRFR